MSTTVVTRTRTRSSSATGVSESEAAGAVEEATTSRRVGSLRSGSRGLISGVVPDSSSVHSG